MSGDGAEGAFSGKLIAVVIAVGAFAFAAFFVLSAFAPDLRRGNDGGAHALSRSAVGYAGLIKLLEAQGVPVEVARTKAARAGAGLLVLTPALGADPDKVRDALRGQGPPTLVILPKWIVEPHPMRPGWVHRRGRYDDQAIQSAAAKWFPRTAFVVAQQKMGEQAVTLAPGVPGGASTPAGRINGLQALIAPDGELDPLLSYKGAVLAQLRDGDRAVFVLSDPDFLNTQGLAELATAGAASAILEDSRTGTAPVVFDVTLNGLAGGRSLLKLAFTPPFLAATLCAAAAAALAGWQAAVRFGPRMRSGRAVALGAEALADNAAALIRQSGREHRMADRYAALTEAATARATAAPSDERAAGYLDGLGRGKPGLARWSSLRAEAKGVRTRAQLLEAARRMHEWKREATGGG